MKDRYKESSYSIHVLYGISERYIAKLSRARCSDDWEYHLGECPLKDNLFWGEITMKEAMYRELEKRWSVSDKHLPLFLIKNTTFLKLPTFFKILWH